MSTLHFFSLSFLVSCVTFFSFSSAQHPYTHYTQEELLALKQIFQWRQANNIDNLLNEDFSEFRKKHPYWIDDGAIQGGPIVSVPVWDIRRLVLGGQLNYALRYIDRIYEEGIQHALNASKVKGMEITQAVMIIDLSAYSPRTHACLACMGFYREFIYHFENYYPQSTSMAFIVNAPRIFNALLEALRPLMSEYTQTNLQVHGVDKEEYRRELLKFIPIDRLRTQFGGKLHDA